MIVARDCGSADGEVRQARESREPRQSARGTYRTLCVRTCDGYYFPISFSTSRDRLPEDERTCQAMCPGTEVKLFYHDNPGGGPENMTALDGEAYTSLATAFQYREKLNEACTCGPAGGATVAGASAPAGATALLISPPPEPRPAPDEDPETLANRAGDLLPRAATPEPAATASLGQGADGRPVRIVGPPHWSSDEQNALVLTPVPN
jgi:hypothetical protein